MKFNNATEFIKWVESQKRFSKKESLDKMHYLMKLFDNPQNKFKSIHITGTNGKGSTVAMLRSILMDKGLNVATFTSPYITVFNERIGFNGYNISNEDLIKYANQILEKYDQIEKDGYEPLTFFEFITVLAFIYFSNIKDLDVAVIEVGMGGRLDCTNVITPVLSMLTNVALDHMQVLGDTLDKILVEKLGIVKNNVGIAIGVKDESLRNIANNYVKEHNSFVKYSSINDLTIKKCDTNLSIFDYKNYSNIELGLIGYHQIENAILVIEAFEIIKDIFNLSKDNLYNGLRNVKWQGRLEVVSKEPYILVDGGHNIDGLTRICEFVKTLNYKNKRAVISISHDKELTEMIKLIDDTFDEIIFTKYAYARSADVDVIYEMSNHQNKKKTENVEEAINYVYNNKTDFTIFVGSLYLVSEVRDIILNKK